jgi:hypothetical protein
MEMKERWKIEKFMEEKAGAALELGRWRCYHGV